MHNSFGAHCNRLLKPKKMKRVLIIAILVIALVGGFIAYRMYNEKTPDVATGQPDVTVDAKELVAAFSADTASASRKYLNKVVEVTGTIKKIDTTGSIVLGEEGSMSEVAVGIDERHHADLKKMKEGSVVTVQGTCTAFSTAGSGDDLFAGLGTTVQLKSAGMKNKK